MKQATLGLFYYVKYAELCFLIIWTGLIFTSSVYLLDTLTDQSTLLGNDAQLIVLVIISLVLVVFNLLFNNLLTNLRFLAKMRCVTFGLCCYDCLNWTMCACILNKPCRDRCFTPWTIGKWIIKAGLIGYTIYLIRYQRTCYGECSWQVGEAY